MNTYSVVIKPRIGGKVCVDTKNWIDTKNTKRARAYH